MLVNRPPGCLPAAVHASQRHLLRLEVENHRVPLETTLCPAEPLGDSNGVCG